MLGLALNPANAEQLLVCTRSPTLFHMTLQGQVRSRQRRFCWIQCTCGPPWCKGSRGWCCWEPKRDMAEVHSLS